MIEILSWLIWDLIKILAYLWSTQLTIKLLRIWCLIKQMNNIIMYQLFYYLPTLYIKHVFNISNGGDK